MWPILLRAAGGNNSSFPNSFSSSQLGALHFSLTTKEHPLVSKMIATPRDMVIFGQKVTCIVHQNSKRLKRESCFCHEEGKRLKREGYLRHEEGVRVPQKSGTVACERSS
jgi:hypothetical protein